jgi:Cytochrome c biogenesis factor
MRLANLGPAKSSLRHIVTPWSITTSVVGFFGDFIKPWISIPPLLLIVSSVGFVAVLILFRKRAKAEGLEKTFNSKLGGFLSYFALSIGAWATLTVIFAVTPPQGVAATVIPGIADLQKEVLKIGKDVGEIKGSVGRIEEKIDQLSKGGTVIPNPQTPEEYYVNARFYEVKGNTGEAVKAYEKFLEMAPNFVDAHLAYQTLMNNTQGIEATRQVYTSLQGKYPDNPVISLMSIRLLPDRNERIAKLKTLSEKHPQSGPVFYELAQEYLRPGPGNITIDDMKQAKQAFDQFKKADEKGGVKPFYIDKKALEAVYNKKEEYDKMVAAFYGSMTEKPLIMSVEILPNLVGLNIAPQEMNYQRIYYSIDDPNPTIDTGISVVKNPATGAPMPNTQVSGKLASGKHILYAKYVNAQGKESAVFSHPFEVTPILAHSSSIPGELGSTTQNFSVIFQSIDGKDYEFFYSVDQPLPDKKTKEPEVALEGLSPGEHELYYYGQSGGQKTEIYRLKLTQ